MKTRRYLVTAGLPYANGRLHVGHIAGAYLPADIYCRYLRARGEEVRFVCGSDDHGVAALLAARQEGTSVEELTARYHTRQREDFKGLGIEFDIYGGTHQPGFAELHQRFSQEFFQKLWEKGFFEKRESLQLYDTEAGQFLPDRYVRGTCYHERSPGVLCGSSEAYGDQCEACGNPIEPLKLKDPKSVITGTTPIPKRTVHWYLQLGRLEEPLRAWLREKGQEQEGSPTWREGTLGFALGQLAQGLPARAMTRDLSWGVPVPLSDPDARGKVLYVWFDAPIGYVSFTAKLCEAREGDPARFARWWKDPTCRIVHFIGEDNTLFHTILWPAMLLAEGSCHLPWQVVANAFLNIKLPDQEEQKISKSRKAAAWVEDFLKNFEPDPLRYYLTAIAPEHQRASFDPLGLVERNNNELADTLGNFIHRTVTFVHRYLGGRVPRRGQGEEADLRHLSTIEAQVEAAGRLLERFSFKAALSEVMALARAANVYMAEKEPWKQRHQNPAGCEATMNICLQTVKALAVLIGPFLPFSARRIAAMLGLPEALFWEEATRELPEGHLLGTPQVLFPKLEPKEVLGHLGFGEP